MAPRRRRPTITPSPLRQSGSLLGREAIEKLTSPAAVSLAPAVMRYRATPSRERRAAVPRHLIDEPGAVSVSRPSKPQQEHARTAEGDRDQLGCNREAVAKEEHGRDQEQRRTDIQQQIALRNPRSGHATSLPLFAVLIGRSVRALIYSGSSGLDRSAGSTALMIPTVLPSGSATSAYLAPQNASYGDCCPS